jgi:hypothetical protein
MARSSSVTPRKNPIHPSALTLNDLTVGRKIVVINNSLGLARYRCKHMLATVVSRPFVAIGGTGQQIKVTLDVEGRRIDYELGSIGVIPNEEGEWSDYTSFIIDARKMHLAVTESSSLMNSPLLFGSVTSRRYDSKLYFAKYENCFRSELEQEQYVNSL